MQGRRLVILFAPKCGAFSRAELFRVKKGTLSNAYTVQLMLTVLAFLYNILYLVL